MKALFPGTFDPFTLGHLRVVEKASTLFSQVVVGISTSRQNTWLDVNTRCQLVEASCKHLNNVSCEVYRDLTAHFARRLNTKVVVRGLRSAVDFEYEKTMSYVNAQLEAALITIHIMTDHNLYHISSSLIREIAAAGGDVKGMLPTPVERWINEQHTVIK